MESCREDVDRSREQSAGSSLHDNQVPLIESASVTGRGGAVLQHSIVDEAGGEQVTVAGQDAGTNTTVTNSATQDARPLQVGVEAASLLPSRAASAAVVPDAAMPRKRGRPKGSKNKPKHGADATEAPKPKRGRPKGSKNKPRRSLDAAMNHEAEATPPQVAATLESRIQSSVHDSETDSTSTGLVPPGSRAEVPSQRLRAAAPPSPEPSQAPSGSDNQVSATPPSVPDTRRSSSGHSPSIAALYVDTLVAFSPAKEGWVSSKKYTGVGNAYIIGRVCRIVKGLYQVRWLDSQFQSHVENLTLSMVQRGNTNYTSLHGHATGPGWGQLCAVDPGEATQIDGSDDGLEICMEAYEPPTLRPSTVAEVEAIKNFRFEPGSHMTEPTDLYHHVDMSTTTRLRPEFRHIFEHSASSSFFAYIPVSFWQQVVGEMNTNARQNSMSIGAPFTLQEIMTFLGILFYMALIDKGEYSNYWGTQVEDSIFGGTSVGLDSIMSLRRFKQLRQAFTFQCVPPDRTNEDQAARIRPLLNLLKSTGSKYVEVGRNVALDEASVACRSKFGKPLIVYNPMKPVGKYHFRIYMLCCATSWISLNFCLHCRSTINDRLAGVTTPETAQALTEELSESSVIRQCVLEVVRPLYGSRRVVNSDNYYTSVQLLEALRVKGLYSRGTVRKSSAHFPRHVLIEKKECSRGTSRQAVSSSHNIVAASWFDSAIVSVISNADASTLTTVQRQVQAEKRTFSAPTCIKEYNTYMQGVDRLDQIRGRFSVADGHSFKKWYKKLGLALVDVARANGFLTRKLAVDLSADRDPHRDYMVQLISELFTGKWKEAPSERVMLFTDTQPANVTSPQPPVSAVWSVGREGVDGVAGSPLKRCSAVSSKQLFKEMSRKRRQCVVCRWEDRYATEVTDYCVLHGVSLCQVVHTAAPKNFMCPHVAWTCWDKYHRYYLPRQLFSNKGKVRTSSELYKLKQQGSATNRTAVRSLVV